MVCGSFNAEGDIVSERVVEQYGLLVNVADEAAKVVDAEVLDVDAITGGFNLQAAWTMAYVVAKSI